MAIGSTRKVTILALIFFALVFIPRTSAIASASSSVPTVIYEPSMALTSTSNPSFSMPLPTPTPGFIAKPAPVSGVLHVVIIAAEFPDIPHTLSTDTIKSEFTQQVAAYYREDSYGKVSLTFDIFGWYKLPYPEAHYGADCMGIDDAGCDGQDASWNIAQDASNLAQKQVNFGNYTDYIFVHSGNGEESSGVKNDVWSVTYLGGVWIRTNSGTLTKFNIVPEMEAGGSVPIGVYCHEFGHQLGLPDLYNTNSGKTILGPWSLMDKGLWNGNPPGSSPSHMDAWSKIQLGFISSSMIATSEPGVTASFTIDATEIASENVHVVEVPLGSNPDPSQYYLIEARSLTGFDSALPSSGVLILYVDNTQLVGKVRIVDGHPSVPDLNDATWDVGQTYTDTKNGWSMTVTGKTGNSYQISVNRGSAQPPIQPPQNETYVDLAVTGVSAQPQVITVPNTNVTITVQISELGTQPVNNVPVDVSLDGQNYTSLEVNIAAGATTQTSFTWISVLGTHVFKITVDPNNEFNDTNRSNNVATFTLNVGPTLTINVPPNITSTSNIWVLINGVKYNITSNQFQASVPNGTITVQIQPGINISQGIRQGFTSWSDGNTNNPRQIVVTSNTMLQPVYATQYLLSVDQNGGVTTPSAWFSANKTVTVSATNPSNLMPNASRLVFSSWIGDVTSNSTTLTVKMNKPVNLQAIWIKQYYVKIISPAGSPTGEGWYNGGSIATVGVQSTIQYVNGTRQIFNGWNSTQLGNNPSAQILVNAPTRLIAAWKTQYLVTVQSPYGNPLGSGWYDAGSSASVAVPSQVSYANATRRTFTGWVGDYSGTSPNLILTVDSPKSLTAMWETQYLLSFTVNGVPNSTILKLNMNNTYHDLSATTNYQAWYEKGTAINPTLNQTVANGIMVYKFTGWKNSTGSIVQGPMAVNSPGTYVASYTTQLSLPPIPGFPIEGIVLGLLFGLLLLAIRRRRFRGKQTVETR